MSRIFDTLSRIRHPKRESIFLSKTKLDPFEHREVPPFWKRLWAQITFDRFVILFFIVVAVFVFAYRAGVNQRSGVSSPRMETKEVPPGSQARPVSGAIQAPAKTPDEPIPAGQAAPAPAVVEEAALPAVPVEPEKLFFTIQLITYKNREFVETEMERLRARGFEAFFILSGNYYQLCIEKFETKADALGELRALRTLGLNEVYPDAYVRPSKR